ncbi:MAG TPA: UDP-2,3-diacylglucosamine diphosphatase LpxI [Pseudorhodoplanes sp.]|jgi:DUF1009 family protein|nr:UDP-2,3-diacylglucosamine diphosphatase LpxI [Pseudorhodoplanes sp.]
MKGPVSGHAEGPLAIICGGGTLPFTVAEAVSRRGREVFIYALNGWADPARVRAYPHRWGAIGQFGRFRRFAREAGCRDVVFIGSLVRPAFSQIRLDLATLRVLPRIVAAFRGGDNHLLTGIGRIFEDAGFHLVGAHEVAPEILMGEGPLGAVAPAAEDLADIALAMQVLRATGPFDIGQAAVVAGRHVLAVEAAEGTDLMLARVAALKKAGRIGAAGGVLVKAPKPGQDRRIDLPSIGPETVEAAARAGLRGVAVAAGSTIVAEPQAVARAADRAGLFVAGVGKEFEP